MKDPSPDKALAARDALYSLRQFVTPDDQKRIDAALLPGARGRSRRRATCARDGTRSTRC